MIATTALAAILAFTLPATGQRHWTSGDTTYVECSGGPAIRSLAMAYLWGQPLTGGGFARVDSHAVIGREGQLDSFVVIRSGNYYVTTRNAVGASCAPDQAVTVFVDSGRTDVPAPESPMGEIVSGKLFNARGQRVPDFQASGVYFAKLRNRAGREFSRKVHFIRGMGPIEDVSTWYRKVVVR